MAKFRKKPVEIEAVQYFPELVDKIEGLLQTPGEYGANYGSGIPGVQVHIHTLEGSMVVRKGDWIITGVNGEKYPCKPDIFEKTYEPVDSGSFRDRVLRELRYGNDTPTERYIAFSGLWISHHIPDRGLISTFINMSDEEVSDELRHKMAEALRRLADSVEPNHYANEPEAQC
jgi:hypothetical protein